MSNTKSFLTGFMTTIGDDIGKKKDDARQYFNDQLEIARTRGMAQRDKMDAKMNASLATAKQLAQVGVPKDLVMSIANQNPDDLPDFLTMINQLQADGVKTDPDFFRSVAKAGGDFKAPDEDLGSFFKRIFEPVRNNAKVDPEAFNRDSHGGIWATLMGDNAQQRAQDKLDTTDVYNGYTAGDLIRGQYNTDTSKPYGDSTVTFDYGKLGDARYAARQARKGEKDLTVYDAKAIVDIFDKTTAEKWNEMKSAAVANNGKESDISEDDAKRAAAAEVMNDYSEFSDKITQIGAISKWLSPTEPSGAPTGPLAFGGSTGTTPAPTASVAPPAAPVDTPVPGAIPLPGGWQAKDNGDGTSTLFKAGVATAIIANDKLKQSVPSSSSAWGNNQITLPNPNSAWGNVGN